MEPGIIHNQKCCSTLAVNNFCEEKSRETALEIELGVISFPFPSLNHMFVR